MKPAKCKIIINKIICKSVIWLKSKIYLEIIVLPVWKSDYIFQMQMNTFEGWWIQSKSEQINTFCTQIYVFELHLDGWMKGMCRDSPTPAIMPLHLSWLLHPTIDTSVSLLELLIRLQMVLTESLLNAIWSIVAHPKNLSLILYLKCIEKFPVGPSNQINIVSMRMKIVSQLS